MNLDARAIGAGAGERPFRDASVAAHEVARIAPMRIGIGGPHFGETRSHRLAADVRVPATSGPAEASNTQSSLMKAIRASTSWRFHASAKSYKFNRDLLNHIGHEPKLRCVILDHGDFMKKKTGGSSSKGGSPSRLIEARIQELDDWRGDMLSRLRALIKQADPAVVEEWKWRGVPVWYHDGMICTGETYKSVVKVTFFKGAQMKDPKKLFNSSLEGNARRAIDFHEGDKINEAAFKALIREAVALNTQ